jgi:hypothetical protein
MRSYSNGCLYAANLQQVWALLQAYAQTQPTAAHGLEAYSQSLQPNNWDTYTAAAAVDAASLPTASLPGALDCLHYTVAMLHYQCITVLHLTTHTRSTTTKQSDTDGPLHLQLQSYHNSKAIQWQAIAMQPC